MVKIDRIYDTSLTLSNPTPGTYALRLNAHERCSGANVNRSTFYKKHTIPDVVTPTVTTTAVSSITSNSASSGGNVTSDGGASVTARGVCWSTSANPTISDSKTTDGTGTGIFTSSITGLSANTTYHVRAYATNSVGTGYGSDISFATSLSACPECTGDPVVLTKVTFASGTNCECSAATSITIGTGVTIKSGATVTFKAPTVKIESGFKAEQGSVVNIKQQ